MRAGRDRLVRRLYEQHLHLTLMRVIHAWRCVVQDAMRRVEASDERAYRLEAVAEVEALRAEHLRVQTQLDSLRLAAGHAEEDFDTSRGVRIHKMAQATTPAANTAIANAYRPATQSKSSQGRVRGRQAALLVSQAHAI
eukprot:CAMPEP_0115879654 /NCGR_PEP_ID=MMETSP0287-20121206/27441_1 /TAXON_ID=412157 /ORGANISM="Chrysochromulina rotalis, Strain UIO044" /LENGTH=138 /DNA_ID=CAMNT_0003335389 /DNA_START=39 /DNA_END=455 /DNA_ORIENTATION=+